jgi:hypothetical protein
VHVADLREQAIEARGGRPLERRLTLAVLAHRVDNIAAFPPLRDEVDDDLGRVLEIGVHHDHRLTGGEVQSRRDGHLVTEVAGEPDRPEPWILAAGRGDQLVAPIAAPVVDEHHLRRTVEPPHQCAKPADQLGETFLLVEDRDHE